jgi:hypothetical protein
MESMETVLAALGAFALKHEVTFDSNGECGFGRECVGFSKDQKWIDYDPLYGSDYRDHPDFPEDLRLHAPAGVDAYHKHKCMAVLGRGEEALRQLLAWVRHLEAQGEVEVVRYATGYIGIQAMVSGTHSHALRLKTKVSQVTPTRSAEEEAYISEYDILNVCDDCRHEERRICMHALAALIRRERAAAWEAGRDACKRAITDAIRCECNMVVHNYLVKPGECERCRPIAAIASLAPPREGE